jgi:hypothetical protein
MWVHRETQQALITVSEMESKYSVEDRRKARSARELSRRLGVPCNKAAYFLAVHNSVEGFQGITRRHFEMADEIWGVRTGTLGGKSTEPPNIKARIEPVFAYKKPVIDIYIDIFFVNREPYLITVAKPIGLIIAAHLPNRMANSIAAGILKHLLVLHKHQHAVRAIFVDGERGISANKDLIERAGIRIQEIVTVHVPQAENVIKTVKSWARGVLVELPYKLPAFWLQT